MGQLAIVGRLALAHWRETLIGILAIALIGACHARDVSIGEKARAELLAHQADSAVKAITPKLARADTQLVHDTVRVRVAVDRVTTLTDTVLRNLRDTVLVREYVTRADSAARACTELSSDCAAFRLYATQKISALEMKFNAQPVALPRSCTTSIVVSALIGAAGGVLASHR